MGEMFQNWPGTGFSATDAPDLSSVTNMNRTFDSATNFNEDLNLWNVSNVESMFRLFQSCSSFNGDVTNWDISNVSDTRNIFNGASSFNQDISGWVFSSSNSLNGMFRGASSFNQDISNWDVSNISSMIDLFSNADSFNQDLSNWDVSNVNSFREMFRNNGGFNQSLGNWQFKAGANFRDFFNGATAIDCQSWSSTILGWYYSNPNVLNLDIQGSNPFEYDSIASIARDKLINEQGWTINGTPIGGECGATFEFPCSDTLQIQNDTLFGHLTISGDLQVDLKNVVFIQPSDIIVRAPIVNIDSLSEMLSGVNFEIINAAGCN
jgi:surface protein